MLSESARPVGLVRAPGALSLSSISNCNIYRIQKAPPAGHAYSDPCFQRAFPSPGLCEKVSANTLKHNGPANRDPSESMSDPVPQPPLFPVRARLAFLWGQPQFFSAFIVRVLFSVHWKSNASRTGIPVRQFGSRNDRDVFAFFS